VNVTEQQYAHRAPDELPIIDRLSILRIRGRTRAIESAG
jgi:hypothetical protein